ncbi:gluconolactonase [Pandoraea terrae]|uniref:Gluconolactonase n=1 Tax=Pandoraea terrae TaxID=1537710 RepID=A0A5E4UX18_9BURK|nr:SMP-30/gluconolactonase/LRE family protein [Pandoraea terrae]VVE03649.1 gluconolactonase [Pandoraea terrae]
MPELSSVVEVAVDAKTRIGECVLWCKFSNALYWTDVEAGSLYRWHPHSGERCSWNLPEKLASFALCEDSDYLLLGLASGVALFNTVTGEVGPISVVEADLSDTRINDGRCDAEGRFVFGTFNHVRGGGPIGGYYRVGPDLAIERLPLPACTVANGIAFSPDGRTIYFADSPTGEIRCAEYGVDGSIGAWRTFVRFADGDGYPDGATVDADGGLWSAHWDGGCVVRYGRDGSETLRITLPVTRPTCVTFGGAERSDLFVSTATIGLKEPQRLAQPSAGAILRVATTYRGQEERRFIFR